MVIFTVTVLGP